MLMNLLCDPWIPVRRADGSRDLISPADLTSNVVSVCSQRPDLEGGIYEFLIALFQTAMAPETEEDWLIYLEDPPSKETIQKALEPFISYFCMSGDGIRFQQDSSLKCNSEKESLAIESLFLNSPGKETLMASKDWFVKRNVVPALCLPCVSAALVTSQTYSAQGGQGHYVGLRGGGPLTTIISGDTLWQTTWFNIQIKGQYALEARETLEEVFPWSVPRTSDATFKFSIDLPALHVFWSMPRRIWLAEPVEGTCSLCQQSGAVVTQYHRASQGIHYDSSGFRHPLTPYYKSKKHSLPVHANIQNVMQYHNWLSYLLPKKDREPALVVQQFRKRQDLITPAPGEGLAITKQMQLKIFGFETDRTKIKGWVDVTTPLYPCYNKDIQEAFDNDICCIAEGTRDAQLKLAEHIQVKRKAKSKPLYSAENAKYEFLRRTENSFFQCVQNLYRARRDNDEETCKKLRTDWGASVMRQALEIFDKIHCNHSVNADIIYPARKKLKQALYGSKGKIVKGLKTSLTPSED
jgi:CRISPR system Cascade subunit CasA